MKKSAILFLIGLVLFVSGTVCGVTDCQNCELRNLNCPDYAYVDGTFTITVDVKGSGPEYPYEHITAWQGKINRRCEQEDLPACSWQNGYSLTVEAPSDPGEKTYYVKCYGALEKSQNNCNIYDEVDATLSCSIDILPVPTMTTTTTTTSTTIPIDTFSPNEYNFNPASETTITTTSPYITFETNENAWCRWGLTDLGYTSMINDCNVGEGTTTHGCSVYGLSVAAGQEVYISCRDSVPNYDSSSRNANLVYSVNPGPLQKSNFNPSTGSTLTSSSFTLTLNTNVDAFCRWSLSDIHYDQMSGNCDEDNSFDTYHVCNVWGLSKGNPTWVYVGCMNAWYTDTAEMNENLYYYPPTTTSTTSTTTTTSTSTTTIIPITTTTMMVPVTITTTTLQATTSTTTLTTTSSTTTTTLTTTSTTTSTISCEAGYLDEYDCSSNNNVIRKYRYPDCSEIWNDWETCEYGCSSGKCNQKTCNEGFVEEYKCSSHAKNVMKKYIRSDCSIKWEKYEGCQYGCANGECVYRDDCTSLEKRCKNGEVWWFNNCGHWKGFYKKCSSNEKCYEGECVPENGEPAEKCTSRYEKKCYHGDLYYYDSCGKRETSHSECTNGCINSECVSSCANVKCPDKCEDYYYLLFNGKCVDGKCRYDKKKCDYKCENGVCKPFPTHSTDYSKIGKLPVSSYFTYADGNVVNTIRCDEQATFVLRVDRNELGCADDVTATLDLPDDFTTYDSPIKTLGRICIGQQKETFWAVSPYSVDTDKTYRICATVMSDNTQKTVTCSDLTITNCGVIPDEGFILEILLGGLGSIFKGGGKKIVKEEIKEVIEKKGLTSSIKGSIDDFVSKAKKFIDGLFGKKSITARGFLDKNRLMDHFKRHGSGVGAKNAAEYEQMANRFLSGKTPPSVLEKVRVNSNIIRYNPSTEEFGVVTKTGRVKTYYKPDPNIHGYKTNFDYFDAQ